LPGSVDATKEGYLWKVGHIFRTWRRRWFVLTDKKLFYYDNPKAKDAKGVVTLKGYLVELLSDLDEQKKIQKKNKYYA